MQTVSSTKFISFIYYLQQIVNLSDEAKEFITKHVYIEKHKKGDLIFRAGELCDNFYFVKKGLIRGLITEDKKDITLWVVDEDNMVTSISGYFTKQLSNESAECIEETIVERFSYNSMQLANKNFPEVYQAYVKLIENYYASSEFRCYVSKLPNA